MKSQKVTKDSSDSEERVRIALNGLGLSTFKQISN
jgi:hypothetical protein